MGIISQFFTSPITAIIFVAALVLAITIHEFSHAWLAYKLGDDTPYLQGRVTLNPAAHLDLFGSLAMLLFGFGWGKPVQYNPMRLKERIYELYIALAGPISNLLLAILVNLLIFVQIKVGFTLIHPLILNIIAQISVLLAAFNILPIPPLDGSSIIAYFWPDYRSLFGGRIGLIIVLALVFISIPGYGNLLSLIIQPIITLFTHITTLFSLIG